MGFYVVLNFPEWYHSCPCCKPTSTHTMQYAMPHASPASHTQLATHKCWDTPHPSVPGNTDIIARLTRPPPYRFRSAIIVPFAAVGADDAYDVMMETQEIVDHPVLGPLSRNILLRVDPSGGLRPEESVFPITRLPGGGWCLWPVVQCSVVLVVVLVVVVVVVSVVFV